MNKGRDTAGLSQITPYLLFVSLALLLTGLQVYHTISQPYTPPEDWAVSWSSAQVSDVSQLSRVFTVDYFPLDIWTAFFGTAEPITRYLYTLFNVLGFAFLFRLCADLFNTKIAFTAIVLLGTLAIVQNLIWQALPYAALLMITPAMLLSWLRWMQNPTRKNAALYFGVGIISVYVCTFSILLIFAQAIFWLLFVPRSQGRDARTLGLFVTITLLALPRILAFNQVNLQSGLPFNSWFTSDLLQLPITIFPAEFAQLIVLLALAVIAIGLARPSRPVLVGHDRLQLRWNATWPLAYLLTMLLLFFMLMGLFSNLTIGVLYGIAALPIVIILAAWGLAAFPGIVQGIALVAAVIFAFTTFRNPMPVVAYQDMIGRTLSASAANNARLVIAAPYVWQHLPFLHYAPPEQIFHMLGDEPPDNFTTLIAPERTAYQDDATSQARFGHFIDHIPEVWLYTEQFSSEWVSDFTTTALQNYDEITPAQRSWYEEETPAYGDLRKFVRVPDDLSNFFVFGDQLLLRAWLLQQSVNVTPCQWITVQSWWSADQGVPNNLSMTLVLVNASDGQGIANADGLATGRDSSALIQETPHVDERSLQIPCNIQSGEYPLLIGVYGLTGDKIDRLPVSLPDGTPVGNFAYLTTLFVQP
jgi:hypothetical protein